MGHRSKRYKKESEQANKEPVSLEEAVGTIKSFNSAKFDQTVECVVNLGIDPKQSDQMVRGSLSLPHGIGKQKRVIAFCQDVEAEQAKQQKIQTAISMGATLLGAFVGRKAISYSTLGRATTTLRGAGRTLKETQDIERARVEG